MKEIPRGETRNSGRMNWIGQVPVEKSGGKKGKIGKNVFNLDVPQVYVSTQRTAGCEENWCHSDTENILEFLHVELCFPLLSCTAISFMKQMQTTASKCCSAHPYPQLRAFNHQKPCGRILAPIYWCVEPKCFRGAWILHKKMKIKCLQSFWKPGNLPGPI